MNRKRIAVNRGEDDGGGGGDIEENATTLSVSTPEYSTDSDAEEGYLFLDHGVVTATQVSAMIGGGRQHGPPAAADGARLPQWSWTSSLTTTANEYDCSERPPAVNRLEDGGSRMKSTVAMAATTTTARTTDGRDNDNEMVIGVYSLDRPIKDANDGRFTMPSDRSSDQLLPVRPCRCDDVASCSVYLDIALDFLAGARATFESGESRPPTGAGRRCLYERVVKMLTADGNSGTVDTTDCSVTQRQCQGENRLERPVLNADGERCVQVNIYEYESTTAMDDENVGKCDDEPKTPIESPEAKSDDPLSSEKTHVKNAGNRLTRYLFRKRYATKQRSLQNASPTTATAVATVGCGAVTCKYRGNHVSTGFAGTRRKGVRFMRIKPLKKNDQDVTTT